MNKDIENEKFQIQLEGKYREAYQMLEEKILINDNYRSSKCDCLYFLLNALIDGQKNNTPLETIIGSDHDSYCNDLLKKYKRISLNECIFSRFFMAMFIGLLTGFIFFLINSIARKNLMFYGAYYNVGMFICYGGGIIVSLADCLWIKLFEHLAFKKNQLVITLRVISALIILGGCTLISFLFNFKRQTSLVNIVIFAIATLILVFFVKGIEKQGGFVGINYGRKMAKYHNDDKNKVKMIYQKQLRNNAESAKPLGKEEFIKETKTNILLIFVFSLILIPLLVGENIFIVVLLCIGNYKPILLITFIIIVMLVWILINIVCSYNTHKKILVDL